MIQLLAFLWSGCWHRWKIIHTIRVFETATSNHPCAHRYELQCERCGSVKARSFSS